MRVLLTGHQGYVGTVLAPMLTAAGHEVCGLDSGLFADCLLGPAPDAPRAHSIDLRDVRQSELDGIDAVIHLAALSNDPLGALNPELTYEINYRASVRLARLAKDAGVRRFLYASTCSVYGAGDTDGLVTEQAPLRPVTPYAESKVRVEDELTKLADSDFSPVFLRNATAFGFSPRLRADIVLNNLVGHAYLSGDVRVLSDGTPWRPLVHVNDIARAFTEALGAPRAVVHAQAFNVGTEQNNLTVADIAAEVVEVVAGSRLVITGETGSDHRSYRVDFSAIRSALKEYTAMWTVKAGAVELLEAYQRHSLGEQDFEQRFTRLARLSARMNHGTIGDDLRVTNPVS